MIQQITFQFYATGDQNNTPSGKRQEILHEKYITLLTAVQTHAIFQMVSTRLNYTIWFL